MTRSSRAQLVFKTRFYVIVVPSGKEYGLVLSPPVGPVAWLLVSWSLGLLVSWTILDVSGGHGLNWQALE